MSKPTSRQKIRSFVAGERGIFACLACGHTLEWPLVIWHGETLQTAAERALPEYTYDYVGLKEECNGCKQRGGLRANEPLIY